MGPEHTVSLPQRQCQTFSLVLFQHGIGREEASSERAPGTLRDTVMGHKGGSSQMPRSLLSLSELRHQHITSSLDFTQPWLPRKARAFCF